MINPIQIIRDFRKWRKERYEEALIDIAHNVAAKNASTYISAETNFVNGILYGIENRKEILKQVKI